MAQNKLENEFRKKLNDREIEPSPAAWDRLDAMLTVGETKKEVPVRKLNWLYIAAGILSFLFIGMMVFNQTGKSDDSNESVVVNEPDTTKTREVAPLLPEQKLLAPEPANEAVATASEIKKPVQRNYRIQNSINPKSPSSLAINDKKLGNEPAILPDNKIDHQIALEDSNSNVDELLASASDPKNESSKSKGRVKVDPNSLLSQVDGELELSFREKAIKTLGKKYNNVKVALANRNKE